MNIDRAVGLIFSIAALLLVLFVILKPQVEYQREFSSIQSNKPSNSFKEKDSFDNTLKSTKEIKTNQKKSDDVVSDIQESDFDVFVLRVHVLSSKENALKIVIKIKEGGFPAFTETFGSKNNLHAVYVGPFITEDDIKSNLEQIKKVSESNNGEIIKWKL